MIYGRKVQPLSRRKSEKKHTEHSNCYRHLLVPNNLNQNTVTVIVHNVGAGVLFSVGCEVLNDVAPFSSFIVLFMMGYYEPRRTLRPLISVSTVWEISQSLNTEQKQPNHDNEYERG